MKKKKPDRNLSYELIRASEKGNIEAVKKLLADGAPAWAKGNFG